MNDEAREALRKRNQNRATLCRGCGGVGSSREEDGSQCGGMPGITYKVCGSCGHAEPKTTRARRVRL